MGHLGMLVFVSPVQHRVPETAVALAESAVRSGHSVRVFFLADGVQCTSRAYLSAPEETVVHRFARLGPRAELVNCGTCARFRGLDDTTLIPNARNGTLEDLVDLLGKSDRFLSFTGET